MTSPSRQGFSKPWLEAASLWAQAVEFLCGGAEEQGRSGSWEQRSSSHSVTLSLRASYLTFLHGLEPCQIKQMAPDQHFTQHPKPNLEKNFLQFTEEVICSILECHPCQLGEKNLEKLSAHLPNTILPVDLCQKFSVCSRHRAFMGIEEVTESWLCICIL